jgi:hypothetical protein
MAEKRTGSDPRRTPPYPEFPGASRPDYNQYAPGVGYTPPYTPPPPPPSGIVGRSKWAWQRYGGLRKRARADSMSWWAMKVLQGLLIGGGPLAFGVLIIVAATLLNTSRWVAWVGMGFALAGLLFLLRYLLAPVTCRWIVTVPENRFCVVEDADGYTAEYLEPGRWIVTWRWNAKVRDYVDFNTVTTNTLIADVLGGNGPVLDMDVTVIMAFNPAEAEPQMGAQLRQVTAREQFETLIARDVRDIVRKHFRLLPPDQQRSALSNTRVFEEVIADELAHYHTMGLTLASSRPVMVYVRSVPPPAAYPLPAYSPSAYLQPDGYQSARPPNPAWVNPSLPPDLTPRPPDQPPSKPEERVPDLPDEKDVPPPKPDEGAPDSRDRPTIKDADHAHDPLTLRRRRRDRDQ